MDRELWGRGCPKIGGLTCELTYVDGKLKVAATRGNPPVTFNGSVRGEAYLIKASLVDRNEQRVKNGDEPFANCRNGAAGILRRKDGRYPLSIQRGEIGGNRIV